MAENPYSSAASRTTPDIMKKREAPAEEVPIRHDRPQQNIKYGYPKSYRLPGEFIEMLAKAGRKWGVAPKEIIQLAVSEYINALETGKVSLPVKDETSRRRLKLPPIPEIK